MKAQKEIIYCDLCGAVIEDHARVSSIKLQINERTYDGTASGRLIEHEDVCSSCIKQINNYIENVVKH